MGRRDAAGEHEGSRRMKTELLIQMDGLSKSDDLVFVLAASNLPWDLDIALLRRLEKRILVPLPNEKARLIMLKTHLTDGERAAGLDYDAIAAKTDGYSGSDIALLCKEAAMRPVRRLMTQLMKVESADQQVSSEVVMEPVVPADVKAALACTRPSAQSKFLQKYAEWARDYGAALHDVTMDGDGTQEE
jgi:katanin p60 ATPase-containing subunit A1